jgi:hypothetical protein
MVKNKSNINWNDFEIFQTFNQKQAEIDFPIPDKFESIRITLDYNDLMLIRKSMIYWAEHGQSVHDFLLCQQLWNRILSEVKRK